MFFQYTILKIAIYLSQIYNKIYNFLKMSLFMITREYIVALINGDYAILEDENKEQISIARALLPMEIDEGTRLLFKNFQYTIID